MAWDGTLTNCAADGSNDLVCAAGMSWMRYEEGSFDAAVLGWHEIAMPDFKIEENPADTGTVTWEVEINCSDDDATWGGWSPFSPGQFYGRYFNFRITIEADPVAGQRPKLTRFEVNGGCFEALARIPEIVATQNTPPVAPTAGRLWCVAVGTDAWAGHNGELALCAETTTPTWRYIKPRAGMETWDVDAGCKRIYDTAWREADERLTAAPHITLLPAAYDHVDAGTWTITADTAQVLNGFIETSSGGAPANADQITWKTGLKADTYTLVLWGLDDADCGILKVYLDSTLVATFDTYQAAPARNQRNVQTGIVVSVAKVYEVIVKVDGKNGSSTGYKAYVSHISIWPE